MIRENYVAALILQTLEANNLHFLKIVLENITRKTGKSDQKTGAPYINDFKAQFYVCRFYLFSYCVLLKLYHIYYINYNVLLQTQSTIQKSNEIISTI